MQDNGTYVMNLEPFISIVSESKINENPVPRQSES